VLHGGCKRSSVTRSMLWQLHNHAVSSGFAAVMNYSSLEP
jgi:hypothetical protein